MIYAAFRFAAGRAAAARRQSLLRPMSIVAAVSILAKQLSVKSAGERPSRAEAATRLEPLLRGDESVRIRMSRANGAGRRFISLHDSAIRDRATTSLAAASRLERP